jgi:hypothetical protein
MAGFASNPQFDEALRKKYSIAQQDADTGRAEQLARAPVFAAQAQQIAGENRNRLDIAGMQYGPGGSADRGDLAMAYGVGGQGDRDNTAMAPGRAAQASNWNEQASNLAQERDFTNQLFPSALASKEFEAKGRDRIGAGWQRADQDRQLATFKSMGGMEPDKLPEGPDVKLDIMNPDRVRQWKEQQRTSKIRFWPDSWTR